MTKGEKVRDQMVPRMSSGLSPLDDKSADDHNLSLRAIGHDCVWMAKGERNDHNLSLHVIGPAASG